MVHMNTNTSKSTKRSIVSLQGRAPCSSLLTRLLTLFLLVFLTLLTEPELLVVFSLCKNRLLELLRLLWYQRVAPLVLSCHWWCSPPHQTVHHHRPPHPVARCTSPRFSLKWLLQHSLASCPPPLNTHTQTFSLCVSDVLVAMLPCCLLTTSVKYQKMPLIKQ